MGILDRIKSKIDRSSQSITDEFYVGKDKKAKIRFLNDLEDAFEVTWHDKYEESIDTPCLSHFGISCPLCDLDKEEVRTREVFVLSVFNHDIDKKQIFKYPANNFSPFPGLVALFENYGTLIDRDIVIARKGTGFDINYQCVPMDKSTFNGTEKPFTKKEIFKKWVKMYEVKKYSQDFDSSNEQEDDDGEALADLF